MTPTARRRGRPPGTRGEKRREAELRREAALTEAASAIRHGMPLSVAGSVYGVKTVTAWYRAHGRQPRRAAHQHQQALTIAEEAQLIEDLDALHRLRHPISHELVRRRAESIRAAKGELRPLSKYWVGHHFMPRHPELRDALSQPKDRVRVHRENDPEALDQFYNNVEFALSVVFPNGESIDPKRVWNMDEKGFLLGIAYRQHVLVFRRRDVGNPSGDPTVTQDGSREFITTVEAVNADGGATQPFIVMKGQRVLLGWASQTPLQGHAHITASPNGWITNELAVEWLENCFIAETSAYANGRWQLLIFDNHESHVSVEFLSMALANRVLPVTLVPHTSGLTQPLDVAVFNIYARAYADQAEKVCSGRTQITKRDFPHILPVARTAAFTRTTIAAGFERTGIYPFNRRALRIMADYYDKLRPSTPESTPRRLRSIPVEPSSPLTPLTNMRHLLPTLTTPQRAAADALMEKYERERAHSGFLSGRIAELRGVEKAAPPDRRRMPGQAKVWTIAEVEAERVRRNAAAASKGRGRALRRGRGRGRGGARGVAMRGAGKMIVDFPGAESSGDDDGEDEEDTEEHPSASGSDSDDDRVEDGRGATPPRREGLRSSSGKQRRVWHREEV